MRPTLLSRGIFSSLLPSSRATAISRTETGQLVQWKPRIEAGPDDYPEPSTQKFDFVSTPSAPPTKRFRAWAVGLTFTIVGFGLPVWIIYSQVLLRTNKQRAQEIVASLPVDEEVLLRAEIALQRKFDLEEAARKKKMGGLYEPRTRPSTF